MKNGIVFLAQFPPPMHGLSKAVETLFNSQLNEKYGFGKIDIANNNAILMTLWKLLTTKSEVIYFTIAQTKGGNWRDLLFLKIIGWRKKKCIVHLHGGFYRKLIDEQCGKLQRKFNYSAVKHVDAAIVLGNSLRPIFEGMVDNEKIAVVPNCIDNEFFAPSVEKKLSLLKNQEKLHVLYLSNFIESKGYREVLQLALLTKQRGDATKLHFHFAGKFFEEKEKVFFKECIRKYQLDDIVTYHGIVSGQKKIDLLRQCNIFALLTRYPNEGQPISILEAMGNGMAIITTDHAGIPDIATMDNGFACSKGLINVDDIYNYLLQCYEDRDMLSMVCLKNYETIQHSYTENQYIANMDTVFERVSHG